MRIDEKQMGEATAGVRDVVACLLRETSLGAMADELVAVASSGKMLRVRLLFRIGAVNGVPVDTLKKAGAAIEMLHAASLLHDDVIDGAAMRRGVPAFWVTKGASGSILLGDLLVCQAFKLMCGVENGRLLPELLDLANEVCEAEAEQELLTKGAKPEWATCVSIARRKTGALFAYAGYVAGGKDPSRCAAFKNAGYAVGTAYQLGDDLVDAFGDSSVTGKTLGSDAKAGKVTAASACRVSNVDPQLYIAGLLKESKGMVAAWPAAAEGWSQYLEADIQPVIDSFVKPFALTP